MPFKIIIFTVQAFLLVAFSSALSAEVLVSVKCTNATGEALVYINGENQGACPIDKFIPAGDITLKVVQRVDADHERLFQKSFYAAEDDVKRFKVRLSGSQLTATAKKRQLAERKKFEKNQANTALSQANEGNIQAMETVAQYYRQGVGIEQNQEKASFWQNKAKATREENAAMRTLSQAKSGDIEAMAKMASLYTDGNGVKKDSQQALFWKNKKTAALQAIKDKAIADQHTIDQAHAAAVLSLAEMGDITAMKEMSELFDTGKGVELNNATARDWRHKALQTERRAEEKEYRDNELADLEKELDELSYFGSTLFLGGFAFDLLKNENREPLMFSVGLTMGPFMTIAGIVGDLTSAPTRTSDKGRLEEEIEALTANWGAPNSMVAKALR